MFPVPTLFGEPFLLDLTAIGASNTTVFHQFKDFSSNEIAALKKPISVFQKTVKKILSPVESGSYQDKLDILEKFKVEIGSDKTFTQVVRRKLLSWINLEIERYRLAAKIKSSSLPFLNRMTNPAENCWRLVMDGNRQTDEFGAYGFEEEEGYMAGMLRAFTLMLETLNDKLTPDLHCRFHDTAVDQVLNKRNERIDQGYGLAFLDTTIGLIEGVNCTKEGLKEFEDSDKKNGSWIKITTYMGRKKLVINRSEGNMYRSRDEVIQSCQTKSNLIFSKYYQELAEAHQIVDPSEKETTILTAIARCCQDLDQNHFFRDGNIRDDAFLTMNKVLLENNLLPVILNDPNVLDMFSVAQIVEEMREGQRTFEKLLNPL